MLVEIRYKLAHGVPPALVATLAPRHALHDGMRAPESAATASCHPSLGRTPRDFPLDSPPHAPPLEPRLRAARRALSCAAACATILLLVTAARAEGPPPAATSANTTRGRGAPVEWSSRRFGIGDAVVTSASAALAATAILIGPTETATTDPQLGVDATVRDALRPDDFQTRRAWRDTSDVLLSFNVSYPLLGDALVNTAWYRSSTDAATQMALIDSEAFVITLGIQQGFANFVGRQRPHGVVCGTDELPSNTASCEVRDRYRSFFSGHTSLSFTAAALTCTHHRHLPLHGPDSNWIPCATGVALATTTGTLRIAGDRHYFTDVVTGAAVGSLVGWVVPYLHYRLPPRKPHAVRARTTLVLLPAPGGLQLQGRF